MKRSTIIAVGVLLTMTMAWAAFGQAGGGGRGKGRGGGRGMMGGPAMQKAVAGLQEQVAKLKALVDENAKMMEGKTYADLSEDERAKMKERSTEQQSLVTAIGQEVDRLRFFQIAREHNTEMTALKEALASAEKEKAKDTVAKLNELIAARQKAFEARGEALGYTPEQMERMGQMGGRRGGRGGQ
jgi:hypothetical protein